MNLLEILKKSWKRIFLYGFVFLLSLCYFVAKGVDPSALAMKIESALSKISAADFQIGSARMALPAGLKMNNVSVADSAGNRIRLENLSVRLLVLPLFTARPTVRFSTYSDGGSLYADISSLGFTGRRLRVSVDAKEFPLNDILSPAKGGRLPINALVDAEGEIEFDPDAPERAAGKLSITLGDVRFVETVFGKGLMDKLNPRQAACEITLDKLMVRTKNCRVVTSMGGFELRVTSRIGRPFERTQLRGSLIVTKPGNLLKPFLSLYKKHKKPDGSYHFRLKGTFLRPGIDL